MKCKCESGKDCEFILDEDVRFGVPRYELKNPLPREEWECGFDPTSELAGPGNAECDAWKPRIETMKKEAEG